MGRLAASFVAFVVALIIGISLSGRSGTEEPGSTAVEPTAATSTTEPRAVFASYSETVLGPAVVITGEPYMSGSQLVVEFDLVSLAPTGDAATVARQLGFGTTLEVLPEDLDTLFLDDWAVEVGNERISGTTANPAARAARFEVGDGFDPTGIDNIVIDSYAVLAPFSADIQLGTGNESAVVAPGVTARLLAVTEQATTIVQIEAVSDRGFNLDNLRMSGIGPGWLSAVREAEGRPRWNLTHESPTAPSPISIRAEGASWIVVDEAIPVILGEDQ